MFNVIVEDKIVGTYNSRPTIKETEWVDITNHVQVCVAGAGSIEISYCGTVLGYINGNTVNTEYIITENTNVSRTVTKPKSDYRISWAQALTSSFIWHLRVWKAK